MPNHTPRNHQPVGVILAGGEGTRIGGGKPAVALQGQALLRYPLQAMKLALADVAVIAKARVVLPQLEGAMVWIEPDLPLHPYIGICEALGLAGGRPVLACPGDMPFVTPGLLSALANADSSLPVVLAASAGVPRPLLGRFAPSAMPLLLEAANQGLGLDEVLPRLQPALIEVDDEVQLFDIDTPDDLLQAAAMIDLQRPSISQT